MHCESTRSPSPDIGGTVTETTGAIGTARAPLRAARPACRARSTFTYRPVDSFGAIGEAVEVEVEVAQLERRQPAADRAVPTRCASGATCRPSSRCWPTTSTPTATDLRIDVDPSRCRPASKSRRAGRRDSRWSCAPARRDFSPVPVHGRRRARAPGPRVGARGADRRRRTQPGPDRQRRQRHGRGRHGDARSTCSPTTATPTATP